MSTGRTQMSGGGPRTPAVPGAEDAGRAAPGGAEATSPQAPLASAADAFGADERTRFRRFVEGETDPARVGAARTSEASIPADADVAPDGPGAVAAEPAVERPLPPEVARFQHLLKNPPQVDERARFQQLSRGGTPALSPSVGASPAPAPRTPSGVGGMLSSLFDVPDDPEAAQGAFVKREFHRREMQAQMQKQQMLDNM